MRSRWKSSVSRDLNASDPVGASSNQEADEASVDSECIRAPLPEEIDNLPSFEDSFDESTPLWNPGTESVAEPSEVGSHGNHKTQHVGELVPVDRTNLRAMIGDSSFGISPTLKFKFPWERKGIANILQKGKRPLVPVPVLPAPNMTAAPSRASDRETFLPSARTRRGAFSEVINFGISMSQEEVDDKAVRQALEKWYVIFSTSEGSWPKGFDLRQAIREHDLDSLKIVFGNRSANTILRRGSSILSFFKWYKETYFHLAPFPATQDAIEEFLMDMRNKGRPASAMHGFIEALNFCQHFLGINVTGGEPVASPKALRILEASDANRSEKKQARVLTVAEVEKLEMCLSDEQISLVDRVACGCMLFCLYSRSRWSDLKKIYGFQSDISEHCGKLSGYIECRTRSHKTARLVARSGLAMPLVAPIWGVASPPWGLTFLRLCESANRTLTKINLAPMLVAPTPEGQWTDRAVTTTEAGKWLRNLLRSFCPSSEYTTIHTMKATPLSWCTKWGVDPYDRQLLGHHATGKASAECYGRDNLAKPLRQFETVLQQIRTRTFVPDATRSGMMQASEVTDPLESFHDSRLHDQVLENGELDEESELTSESDVQGPGTSSDEDDLDCFDSMAAPRQWAPDTTMYQNRKSKVVHVVAQGGAPSFSCGVQITSDYREIAESAFLDIRRCRRCAVARPIKTVGQFASAFKKMRLEG